MKSCFGTMYPDLEKFQLGEPLAGKVFQIYVSTVGGGQRDRRLEIDQEAWQDCRRCEDFQNCYDFSTAKLHMQRVLTSS